MDSWMLLKEEAKRSFKLKNYREACDHYKKALTEIESKFDESNHQLKVEGAEIASNISLMYYKLSKEQNDDSLLHESRIYAKKAISYNPKEILGYLRLAHVCKQSKNLDDILTAITVYLQDNKDDVLNDDFISLLKDIKYYTHKTIMELSPSWDLVKYKNNVYVVDSLGAGDFKDFNEFSTCYGESIENISVLVRPGVYAGRYIFINANIDIVGDCNIEINPITKAIDKDPTVIFANTFLVPTAIKITSSTAHSTFFFDDSVVSLKRISVYGKLDDLSCLAIACKRTVINLLECSFVSYNSESIVCSESSKLYCKRCRSVGGFHGVEINKSHARLTDCFFSEKEGKGIQVRDESEMISLKHCTITKCKQQGLVTYNGTKKVKVIDSHFKGNCLKEWGMGSIHSSGECRVLVKNTFVQNSDSIGIVIGGGSGNFDNVLIENCFTGMIVGANVEISECIINGCSHIGIQIIKVIKGAVVLENNSITKCPIEIARSDDAPIPTLRGEKKHAIITIPSIDSKNENIYKEMRKARREGSIDARYCDHCGKTLLELQHESKTLKTCDNCKMVLYCSPECQQKAWKLHEPHCEMFAKTKLAAIEKQAIQTNLERTNKNKKSNFNETKENDGIL